MKQELGWWFPDGEVHLPDWMRKAKQMRDGVHQYQLTKYQTALNFVKRRGVAVDVGGHIGQWSRNMAMDFGQVHAFEPVPAYAECWRKNMEGFANATLHQVALGAKEAIANLACGTPGSHGDTFVVEKENANAATDVPMHRIDDLALGSVDFIKVDCEGYEFFVLKGAEQTVKRDRPCIIVEQKPGRAQKFGLGQIDAVNLLEGWGARRRVELSGDYVMSW